MVTDKEGPETVTHLSTTEARGGSPTRMTRNILAISLVLVAVLLALAVGFGFFQTSQTGADDVNNDSRPVSQANSSVP